MSPLDDGHRNAAAALVLNIIPSHKVWCEPYFFAGEVFFRKRPSCKEIINDAENNIVNFYLMIRNRWEQLYFLMESTLHCDFFSRMADKIMQDGNAEELYRAWAFWLVCNKAFVAPERWSIDNILPTKDSSDAVLRKKMLEILSRRLTDVYISNRQPQDVIVEADGPDTLFFLCPHSKKDLKTIESLWPQIKGKIILLTTEENRMKKMRNRLDIYTDEDCLPLGIYTNFKRQHSLFE